MKTTLACMLFAAQQAYSQTNLPPTSTSATYYGQTTDVLFNPNIGRDGGGGALVNGQHFIVFSDSFIINTDDFVHNTVAYMSDPDSPHQLADFGPPGPGGSREWINPPPLAAVNEGETALGNNFALWPNNQWAAYNTTHAVGFVNAMDVSDGSDLKFLYYSLCLLEIQNPGPSSGTLTGTRPIASIWPTGVKYGAHGLYQSPDGNLYMFGWNNVTSGMRVARVENGESVFVQSEYTYWDGSTWSSTIPDTSDTAADIYTTGNGNGDGNVDTGEVFYSDYFKTMVHIIHGDLDGSFKITYAVNNDITGEWGAISNIYTTPPNPSGYDCTIDYIYAGHAYPDWDPSGKTMTFSWSGCSTANVFMSTVTFA